MLPHSNLDKVHEPITSAAPEIRTIIEEVLKLEKSKLYQKTPKHINDDILKIIKSYIN